MYDRVELTGDGVRVVQGEAVSAVHKYGWIIVAILCIIFPTVLICSMDSPYRFGAIPVFILIFLYFKFIFLPSRRPGEKVVKLDWGKEKFTYFDGTVTYQVQVSDILGVSDRSVHRDTGGTEGYSWRHAFACSLRPGCELTRIYPDGRQERIDAAQVEGEVYVHTLVLLHDAYEKMYQALEREIR